jgi:hypothetical protein
MVHRDTTPGGTTVTEATEFFVAPNHYTAALSYNIQLKYYTETPVYYTTTYATSNYYTVAPKYYTEKVEYYTTTYAVLVYYTEEPEPKYSPSFYQCS